jgi:hypothetical protein
MDAFAAQLFASKGDSRTVVADSSATCFGAAVDDTSLVPAGQPDAWHDALRDWLSAEAERPRNQARPL